MKPEDKHYSHLITFFLSFDFILIEFSCINTQTLFFTLCRLNQAPCTCENQLITFEYRALDQTDDAIALRAFDDRNRFIPMSERDKKNKNSHTNATKPEKRRCRICRCFGDKNRVRNSIFECCTLKTRFIG